MEITIIKNDNDEKITAYKLARIIFAETKGVSLLAVESIAAMIQNIHKSNNTDFSEIAKDSKIFESLNKKSERHKYLYVDPQDRKFQMCLRVVQRMLKNRINDCVMGATRFHRGDVFPNWATSLGYVAETEDLFFYI